MNEDLKKLYKQEFLYYYKNQPYKKTIRNPTHKGKEMNLNCGDEITVKLVIQNNKIKDIAYQSDSCAIAEGSMSILADEIIDKNISIIKKLTEKNHLENINIQLTESRKNCALLGYKALIKALK